MEFIRGVQLLILSTMALLPHGSTIQAPTLKVFQLARGVACVNNVERYIVFQTNTTATHTFQTSTNEGYPIAVEGLWELCKTEPWVLCPDNQRYILSPRDDCGTYYNFPENGTITVTNLGNDDLSAKEIRLFSQINFDTRTIGRVKIIGDDEYQIEGGMSVLSLLFTGNHFWSLYFEEGCKGRPLCLEPALLVQQSGAGVTYMKRADFGSPVHCVRSGCT